MGNFYTNIVLKGASRQSVLELLQGMRRDAFVASPQPDVTVVYDAEADEQNAEALCELACQLSRQFDCVAWAVLNHDDDIFWYRLYVAGKAVDEYDSAPGYFGAAGPSAPAGGDPAKLAGTFGCEASAPAIEAALRKSLLDPGGGVFLASERHRQVAEALGLPIGLLALGYNYIEGGDADELGPGTFVGTNE